MKNVDEFIENMVHIDFLEDEECYGHYPFQMFVEKEDGTHDINALALGGDVESCYKRATEYKQNNAKKIYLSLDFGCGGDIIHDFIAIFSFENGVVSIVAISYDIKNGKKFETITNSTHLNKIKGDFEYYLFKK